VNHIRPEIAEHMRQPHDNGRTQPRLFAQLDHRHLWGQPLGEGPRFGQAADGECKSSPLKCAHPIHHSVLHAASSQRMHDMQDSNNPLVMFRLNNAHFTLLLWLLKNAKMNTAKLKSMRWRKSC
jgi:hypothetical protein